jgi:membrane associated rhomboid family serine protease
VVESTKTAALRNASIFNLRGVPIEWHVPGYAMFGDSDSRDDYQPYGYIGRIPLFTPTILVILYVAFMAAFALIIAAHGPDFTPILAYDSTWVIHSYQVWRLFSYAALNGPSIWFAVEMYLLFSFGREVEKFIGRRAFAMLYLSLVAVAPCVLSAAGPWLPSTFLGSGAVNFAIFVAFATIYPNAEIFIVLRAKWIALVILGIFTLADLRDHDLVDLLVLWTTSLTAFLFIKYLRGQVRFSLPNFFRLRRSRRNLRVLPTPPSASQRKLPSPGEDVIESIDPLLDKIAKHGIGSLTDREREKLEQARAALLKKQ